MDFDSIFTVGSMNLKTADILSGYYNILNKRREELEAKNQPEINPEPQDLDDGNSFKPTYIRHKIFDPVKKKNIWVPNKRLYDPRWLERKTSQVAVQENQNSSMYPEDVLYGSWEGQTRCIKEMNPAINEAQQRFLSIPTQDHVRKDCIHVESLRKQRLCTERLSSSETKFHINPFTQKSPVSHKIWDRFHGVSKPRDQEFIDLESRSRQSPEDRFPLPQTSNQEIGWFSKTPLAINRGDGRVDFPRVEGELSKYMATYWRVVTEAPASSVNVRSRTLLCPRHNEART